MLSHERVWAAIDALATRHSLSASALARRAGLDSTAFNKSKRHSPDGRPRWPSTESLAKVMEATGATFGDFVAIVAGLEKGPQPGPAIGIPLIGFAQAGAGGYFDDGGFPVGQGWEMVEQPTGGAADGSYALRVQGESMLPLYRDGDVLIVHPGATVRRGDRVVVKTIGGEVMAKILSRRSGEGVELLSLNPEHPTRQFGTAEIEWIARIVWASQ